MTGNWILKNALTTTDEAQARWAEYALSGDEGAVVLRFAWTDRKNEGTLISVTIDGSPNVKAAGDVATSLMQSFPSTSVRTFRGDSLRGQWRTLAQPTSRHAVVLSR